MTTPRVTELPRRLEPIGGDTFLGGCEPDPRPRMAVVVQLPPRDANSPRRTRRPAPPRRPMTGPGGDAA